MIILTVFWSSLHYTCVLLRQRSIMRVLYQSMVCICFIMFLFALLNHRQRWDANGYYSTAITSHRFIVPTCPSIWAESKRLWRMDLLRRMVSLQNKNSWLCWLNMIEEKLDFDVIVMATGFVAVSTVQAIVEIYVKLVIGRLPNLSQRKKRSNYMWLLPEFRWSHGIPWHDSS